MDYQIEDIFIPGKSVDIVYNLNSLSPIARSSMIFDTAFNENEMIISQTTPRTFKSFQFDTMHITALKSTKNAKIRLGLKCSIKEFIQAYKLNRETTEQALKVAYKKNTSIEQVNIRSAFRIQPNNVYSVMAKLGYKGKEFFSGKQFKILDISLSGIGLLIPNIPDPVKNPLIEMEPGDKAKIGLIIKSPGHAKDAPPELNKLLNDIKIVRIHKNFNPNFTLVGCQFSNWDIKKEEELGHFIHQLQLFEIRHLNTLK